MERDGKSAESRAHTWSTGIIVIRYVAVIVLTSPTLGNAATTVPPFRLTSLIVRTSTSDIGPRSRLEAASRLSRFGNPPSGGSTPDRRARSFERHRGTYAHPAPSGR